PARSGSVSNTLASRRRPTNISASSAARRGLRRWRWRRWTYSSEFRVPGSELRASANFEPGTRNSEPGTKANAQGRKQLETRDGGWREAPGLRATRRSGVAVFPSPKEVRSMAADRGTTTGGLVGAARCRAAIDHAKAVAAG